WVQFNKGAADAGPCGPNGLLIFFTTLYFASDGREHSSPGSDAVLVLCELPSGFFRMPFAQAHPWLTAIPIHELNAGCLERAANRQIVSCRHRSFTLR